MNCKQNKVYINEQEIYKVWQIMVEVYTSFVLTRGVGDFGANEENNGGSTTIESLRLMT
jgi:hypothetical protein